MLCHEKAAAQWVVAPRCGVGAGLRQAHQARLPSAADPLRLHLNPRSPPPSVSASQTESQSASASPNQARSEEERREENGVNKQLVWSLRRVDGYLHENGHKSTLPGPPPSKFAQSHTTRLSWNANSPDAAGRRTSSSPALRRYATYCERQATS